MRLTKLISRRAHKCAHCEETIEVGEVYVNLSGATEETQGASGRMHVSCFIYLFQRLPAKQ